MTNWQARQTLHQLNMKTKLVESLVQVILSLSYEERLLLEEKLFFDGSYPSTRDMMQLTQIGGSFNCFYDQLDLYTLQDGEPI